MMDIEPSLASDDSPSPTANDSPSDDAGKSTDGGRDSPYSSVVDPPDATSKKVEHSSKPDWLGRARTALRLAGAGGTLVAVGYIANAGHDELLGVNFPVNRTLTDYGLSGGRFFIDLVIKSGSHPWILLISLTVIGVSASILATFRRQWPRSSLVKMIGFLWIAAIFIWKAYRFDAPYIELDGILKRTPLDEPLTQMTSPSWQRFKDTTLRDKFVCTHIVAETDDITKALNLKFPQCTTMTMRTETISSESLADILLPSASHESFSIEQEFVIDVFAAVYLMVLAIIVATPLVDKAPPSSDEAATVSKTAPADVTKVIGTRPEFVRTINALAIIGTLASFVTLPYVYGKVIQSTEAPAGRIAFDSVDATSKPAMKPTVAFAKGLLIWADDKFVTLYRSDSFEFLHLSRDRVRYIAIDRSYDIIRVYAHAFCPTEQPHPINNRRHD